MITLKDIAAYYKVDRRQLMRWFKYFGISHRGISEDNKRRYSRMNQDQIKEQTKSANKKFRQLMKNPKWKANQVRKIMEAQNFKESKIERIVKEELNKRGLQFKEQHQICYWFIDITFPKDKLAVEIDGDYWHSLEKQKEKDKNKDH